MNAQSKETHCQAPRAFAGFTLVEILVVVSIIAALALLSLLIVRKGMDSARTSTSLSNLRQLHTGTMYFAADNGMRLPLNYFTGTPTPGFSNFRDLYWYRAITMYLYSDAYEKAPSYYGNPLLIREAALKGTVLVSPNAENRNDPSIIVSSYGYNAKFNIDNKPYTYLSRYDNSRTCMFADNSGKTHSLGFGAIDHPRVINPRNGASSPYKRDGKAAVIYLDGHVETLSAIQAKEINGDRNHQFWGVEPTP